MTPMIFQPPRRGSPSTELLDPPQPISHPHRYHTLVCPPVRRSSRPPFDQQQLSDLSIVYVLPSLLPLPLHPIGVRWAGDCLIWPLLCDRRYPDDLTSHYILPTRWSRGS
ncbi:hypothetical protein BO71DRAFT_135198 [Aspergillus ellipticus CBS 707.79]|uniref:Uncharacterized protein n=1 Tax=Aspergillus ellipticus CBS 707.79 TaxID=1448320 RepID=A0A319E0X0_9EURO|nr:hypothetical protein BO71DRAFT_135198 [Aspergillus ellipticus CBS 707.79]